MVDDVPQHQDHLYLVSPNMVPPSPPLVSPKMVPPSVPYSLDVVDPELWGLDPLPARGQPLLLERVRPVRRLGVVVDEVATPAHRVPHTPPQRQRQLGV